MRYYKSNNGSIQASIREIDGLIEISEVEYNTLKAEFDKKVDTYDYPSEVERLIRERYSLSDELAIQRQRDTKPDEFQAYFEYCEECKEKARRLKEE